MNNPHYEDARSCFSAASSGAEREFNEAVRADALIQATLALAYEQQTANLIAIYTDGNPGIDHVGLIEQIKGRLEL
jgi:hypothetical protein